MYEGGVVKFYSSTPYLPVEFVQQYEIRWSSCTVLTIVHTGRRYKYRLRL
jgi:hypothetical protein